MNLLVFQKGNERQLLTDFIIDVIFYTYKHRLNNTTLITHNFIAISQHVPTVKGSLLLIAHSPHTIERNYNLPAEYSTGLQVSAI